MSLVLGTYKPTADFLIDVSRGRVPGHSIVHKFGRNTSVGTTLVPICEGGIYRTPQVGSATALRIKAGGNANDTAAGSGAREVTLIGLDETGTEVTETLATNGASASSATTTTFIRLYRLFVSASGTYATATTGSHSGDIVIENSAGTEDWATISSGVWAASQSEIGAYSVPLGKTAYVLSHAVNVDSSKNATVIFFQRQNILETSAPYTAMREVYDFAPITELFHISPHSPLGPYPECTDIGFMGKINTGTAEIDVDFEILLIDN